MLTRRPDTVTIGDRQCGVEQLVVRKPHKLQVAGSSPAPATAAEGQVQGGSPTGWTSLGENNPVNLGCRARRAAKLRDQLSQDHAGLAHLVEQCSCKAQVTSSSLVSSSPEHPQEGTQYGNTSTARPGTPPPSGRRLGRFRVRDHVGRRLTRHLVVRLRLVLFQLRQWQQLERRWLRLALRVRSSVG